MSHAEGNDIDRLVATVRESAKYRSVHEAMIRELGARELANRGNPKDAVKATKNKLHQIGGAYLPVTPTYRRWESDLRLTDGDPDQLAAVCERIMRSHASTNERLPVLASFYRQILEPLGPVASVVDVACGFNPLAISWMPLIPQFRYFAYDIYEDMASLLNLYFSVAMISGRAETHDAVHYAPSEDFDVALVFKFLPCLDQVDKTASLRLLQSLRAPRIVVSYPVHSLGGQDRGMPAHYEGRFRELIAGQPWTYRRLDFPTELVFVIEK